MKRIQLYTNKPHPDLNDFANTLHEGRYFKTFNTDVLKKILKKGDLISLELDDILIKEGDDAPPELYILIEGSLAVMAQGNFILRLEQPGDIAGELSILTPGPRSAEVIAETFCRVVAFPQEVFTVEEASQTVPVFYFMFSYILAEKLRITTAQSLIRKNNRVTSTGNIKIAVIDENDIDRVIICGVVNSEWPDVQITEFKSATEFIDSAVSQIFDIYIGDLKYNHTQKTEDEAIKHLFEAMKIRDTPVFIISELCADVLKREKIMKLGAADLLSKPFSIFDLKHSVVKLKVGFYQKRELDIIEQDADTDRLTGLANRRRLDQFLEALITVYPDNRQPFSLIMSDVDNFKHYNDSHGHQMGDVVLSGVASIFNRTVRKGDLAARFGGEEFVMILPNCDKDNAKLVAEKIREAIEDEDFPFQDQQPTGNLTITLGVATFPKDANTVEKLLKKADDCLYQGKEAGRNIVIVA